VIAVEMRDQDPLDLERRPRREATRRREHARVQVADGGAQVRYVP